MGNWLVDGRGESKGLGGAGRKQKIRLRNPEGPKRNARGGGREEYNGEGTLGDLPKQTTAGGGVLGRKHRLFRTIEKMGKKKSKGRSKNPSRGGGEKKRTKARGECRTESEGVQ